VEFVFPDENGTPYKSSSGEMIESELGVTFMRSMSFQKLR
jgi:hypothetical protein